MNERIVLCVDDEMDILRALQRELRQVATQVLTATSGKQGIELLVEYPVAVVVTDMRMPEMDGAAFLQRVLDFAPDTFRILLTGHADIQAAISAVNGGEIHRYLHKPWDATELARAVEQGFERYELIRENLALSDSLSERNQALNELNEMLEQRVAERTQQLLHSERLSAVGRLAAGIVHEVMTPLTIAIGWVETVAKAESLNADQRQSLVTASEQIMRAAIIMENMQGFSRKKHASKHATNINSLIEHTIDLMIHPMRQKTIAVSHSLTVNNMVIVDQGEMSQVLLNLLGNAIDALGTGGKLAISTNTCESPDGIHFLEVRIKDNGHGISPNSIKRIFEPFFTTKGSSGTGLGLSICKGIIEGHGGELKVESKPGQGSTFSFTVPLNVPL